MTFFDLDGTLLDSNGVWLDVDYAFAAKRGKVVTEEYTYQMGHSIFPVAAQITKDWYQLEESVQEIMDEWTRMAYHAYAHTIPLKEGAVELLKKLQSQGEPMVLLTAGLPKLARAAVERHGLGQYFQGLFFAHEAGLEKRDPEIYRLAARQYGADPQNCTLYEDAPYNCKAAQEAGFSVVGVYDEFYRNAWADVVRSSHRAVRSLSELL